MYFIPGCPTGLVNHVDKNGRPDVLIWADIKVVSRKKVRTNTFSLILKPSEND